jgi:hypothetical protein
MSKEDFKDYDLNDLSDSYINVEHIIDCAIDSAFEELNTQIDDIKGLPQSRKDKLFDFVNTLFAIKHT